MADELGLARKGDVRKAAVREYVCSRVRAALAVTKGCRSERQRVEHGTLLAAVMPRAEDHMLDAVAEELHFRYDKRKGGRERAATKAMATRAAFDAAAATVDVFPPHRVVNVFDPMAGWNPICEGEAVLCNGQPAELEKIFEDGGCRVVFRFEGESQRVDYKQMYGHGKGTARLQRPPPTLQPAMRATREDDKAEVREHVREVYEATCATSPHQRDGMKRRLERHVVQVDSPLPLPCTHAHTVGSAGPMWLWAPPRRGRC